ncbi:MAG: 2-amino-4-hydroxy-6-hydroxymethyldihydropteridine diphosphokinase [Verrucomicrobiota bacterium]|jgi:2-amino-4-hydroxy-6-hydroxymethyldihydropteridine diphosphokinase
MSAPNAVIALGSNLGNSRATLLAAIDRLSQVGAPGMAKSSLWQSSPVGCPPNSPMFVNAVVCLQLHPDETPESLLKKLQSIEKDFGRRPKIEMNEPRPLDLDLIAFGSESRQTPGLILPHPRAHLRRFVLQPLNEIAPDLILPGQRRPVCELLARLDTDEILQCLD